MKYATLGSVSIGTLRDRDLIEKFYHELEYQLARNDDPADREYLAPERATLGKVCDECWDENGQFVESDETPYVTEELFDALQTFAGPCCYFGAHIGDGADFGFWMSEEALGEFDGLRVDDTADVPADYIGEVLHVSDHGNVTIYIAENGELTEVVSCV